MKTGLYVILPLLLLIFSFGCASRVVPPELAGKVNRSLSFEQLLRNPDRYKGEMVVYGGVILSSVNRSEGTVIEILQKPLSRTDEPEDVDQSYGRFLAVYDGYLETTVYSKDRRVTVLGVVAGREKRPIGEITYVYPKIMIKKIHLWPVMQENAYPPYWYDPFFYPSWYGPYYYRYPYHSPYWR
jgi:outer membrane lipoprotein